jgi:uncharacterized membrane protein
MNNLIGDRNGTMPKYIEQSVAIILILGVGIRLFHYLYNRSLWMDEVYLVSSLVHMNYSDLATKALDYGQKAPLGFLLLAKVPITFFGNHEMILRIIPFLAGISSLLLFVPVCRYFLKPVGVLVALSIFAFAPAMVYHTSEIKQYAMECLATVIALYLYTRYGEKNDWRSRLSWGILGSLLVWFSFSVIFILAGIAFGTCLNYILKKEWKSLLINIFPFCIWLISFALNYLMFTHKHAESEWVVYFFKTYDNFMPFPPRSLQELKWFPRNFIALFDYPLGLVWNFSSETTNFLAKLLAIPLLPIVLLFTGAYTCYKRNIKNFFVFLIPLLLMMIASGLQLYPLIERFWVFAVPIFILFIVLGFEFIQEKLKSWKAISVIALILIIGPFIQSTYAIVKPGTFYKHKKSSEQEALNYINTNFKKGDVVYNYWNNAPGYQVYKQIIKYQFNAIQGIDHRKKAKDLTDYNSKLNEDFKAINGYKRVWLIFNHQFLTDIGDRIDDPKWYYENHSTPIDNLLGQFNKVGKPLKKYVYSDVTIYIFELKHSKDNSIH